MSPGTTPGGHGKGWYLWDWERGRVLRGPYEQSQTAGAVRSEMERRDDSLNIWIVDHDTVDMWEAELHEARS